MPAHIGEVISIYREALSIELQTILEIEMALYLRSASDFGESFFEEKEGRIIIDLLNAASSADVALKIGHVLRGASSPLLAHGSWDAMHDVVSDWVMGNADKQTNVLLLNCNKIEEIERNLLAKLALNLSSAFMIGIAAKKIENQEFNMYTGMNNINIYFILNDK
jgi:hypothetical protein